MGFGVGRIFQGVRFAFACFLFLAVLSGCAGYRQTLENCYFYAKAQNYEKALATLDRSFLAHSRKNKLLYLMEKGHLLHLKGDYRESNQIFEQADHLAEELFTRSLSAESLSFVTNDSLIPYPGEDYESVYLNYYKALNYLALGELDEARVECRKVDEKLNYFTDTYEGRNVFKESAFLRFLTGLIYEAQGDPNNAFIAYRKSLAAYRTYWEKYRVAAPKALWSRLLVSARRTGFADEYQKYLKQARAAGVDPDEEGTIIAVIVDKGFAPVKREVFAFFPTEYGFPVKLAVPEFQSGPPVIGSIEVSVDGGKWVKAERVEDVDAIARQSLADKKGRVLVKAVARAVAKQLAARQAQEEYGPLAGLTAQVAALLTERADLRSWTLLPAEILLAVVPAKPGWNTVTISLGGSQESRRVKLEENSVGFVNFRAF
jgi:hypothetical protein